MQIACKYRSLSRYRSKRSLSLYIPRSRYVFFSRFSTALVRFYTRHPCLFLFLSFSPPVRGASKGRNQSRDKVSTNEIVTEFFLIPLSRVRFFNPLVEVECRQVLYYSVSRLAPIPVNLRDTVYCWRLICQRKKKKKKRCKFLCAGSGVFSI